MRKWFYRGRDVKMRNEARNVTNLLRSPLQVPILLTMPAGRQASCFILERHGFVPFHVTQIVAIASLHQKYSTVHLCLECKDWMCRFITKQDIVVTSPNRDNLFNQPPSIFFFFDKAVAVKGWKPVQVTGYALPRRKWVRVSHNTFSRTRIHTLISRSQLSLRLSLV